MAYNSLRSWIQTLQANGELKVLSDEVDWSLEAGAIARRSCDVGGPALLFENVKDYKGKGRILGAPLGLSQRNKFARLASAFEMPAQSSFREITEEYIRRRQNTIHPVILDSAPWKENVHVGSEIDLYEFPAPLIHQGDGGRYLGTWHTVITRDPDSGWVNYGIYRLMLSDKNHLGGLVGNRQHMRQMLDKCIEQNRTLEFAIAIGTEPITTLVSGSSVPDYVNEADVAGALRQEPLELTPCETVSLHAPTSAEIVIEGYIDPSELRPEGPFGEYPGYNAGGSDPRLVYTVTAICHRDNPIIPMSAIGVPVDDNHVLISTGVSAEILRELRDEMGYPVDFVYQPPEAAQHLFVISTKVPNKTYVKQLAMALWSTKGGRVFGNNVIVVNDDVDPTNLKQVLWALITRCHPDRGIWKVPHTYTSWLIPWMTPTERSHNDGASVLFDATWPAEWPDEWVPKVASFDQMWPPEIQQKVLNYWSTRCGF